MDSFEEILNRPAEDAERPKPLPQGTYTATVQSYRIDKTTRTQTDFVEFTLKVLQAEDDVDPAELKAAGGIGEATLTHTLYLTDKAEYRLKEFLTNCGVPLREGRNKLTHQERLDMSTGCQLTIHVKHVTSQDGSTIYANVDKTLPIE